MKLEAKARIKAAESGTDWFSQMSKEQQAEYIKQHPNSKYAAGAGKPAASAPVSAPETKKPPAIEDYRDLPEYQKVFNKLRELRNLGEDYLDGNPRARDMKKLFEGQLNQLMTDHPIKKAAPKQVSKPVKLGDSTAPPAESKAQGLNKLQETFGVEASKRYRIVFKKNDAIELNPADSAKLLKSLAKDYTLKWKDESAGTAINSKGERVFDIEYGRDNTVLLRTSDLEFSKQDTDNAATWYTQREDAAGPYR